MIFKTGKLPKVTDERTLQLARYLPAAQALPAPPPSVDYSAAVTAWGMMGNDRVGDCALAGMGHADLLWAANAERRRLRITTAMVIAAYSKVTGYVPGDPSTDRGTALLDALRFWGKQGIDRQTVRAFVEVDPRDTENVKRTIDWFGCAYLGVELPDAVLPTSPTAAGVDLLAGRLAGEAAQPPQRPLRHLLRLQRRRAGGRHLGHYGAGLLGLPRRLLRRALCPARAVLAAGRLAAADQPAVRRSGAGRRPAGARRLEEVPT